MDKKTHFCGFPLTNGLTNGWQLAPHFDNWHRKTPKKLQKRCLDVISHKIRV